MKFALMEGTQYAVYIKWRGIFSVVPETVIGGKVHYQYTKDVFSFV